MSSSDAEVQVRLSWINTRLPSSGVRPSEFPPRAWDLFVIAVGIGSKVKPELARLGTLVKLTMVLFQDENTSFMNSALAWNVVVANKFRRLLSEVEDPLISLTKSDTFDMRIVLSICGWISRKGWMEAGGLTRDELLLVWARLLEMRNPYSELQKQVIMTDTYGSKSSDEAKLANASIWWSIEDIGNVIDPPR